METVVIACASDRTYARPLAAMLRSVADNLGPNRRADVYVLQSGIDDHAADAITSGFSRDRCNIHWVAARESSFEGLPLWGRMPVSTYFKLALPDILPARVNKAIWLDCDLLVLDDIGVLWDEELGDNRLLAVQDAVVPLVSSRCGIEHYADLGIDPGEKYFNAGVMVVDVAAWREGKIQQRAIAYLKRFESSVVFWDQEALNAVLVNRWKELPARWNNNASVPSARRDADRGPAILHFAGSLKPWSYRTADPVRNLYYEYLDRTTFAGWRPGASIAGTMVSLYEGSGLRNVMYPAENLGMRMIRGLSRR
jgi:lipopolysaccharide biosynthesis glycosyltransferase